MECTSRQKRGMNEPGRTSELSTSAVYGHITLRFPHHQSYASNVKMGKGGVQLTPGFSLLVPVASSGSLCSKFTTENGFCLFHFDTLNRGCSRKLDTTTARQAEETRIGVKAPDYYPLDALHVVPCRRFGRQTREVTPKPREQRGEINLWQCDLSEWMRVRFSSWMRVRFVRRAFNFLRREVDLLGSSKTTDNLVG